MTTKWPTADLQRRILATTDQIAQMRHELVAWAEHAGLDVTIVDDLALASYEAMANTVEHAYGHHAGPVDVYATIANGEHRVTVTVTDYGRWKSPPTMPGTLRGRGLPLIHTLTHAVSLVPSGCGTSIRMYWILLDS